MEPDFSCFDELMIHETIFNVYTILSHIYNCQYNIINVLFLAFQNLRHLSHKGVAHWKLTKGTWRLVSIENVRFTVEGSVVVWIVLILWTIELKLKQDDEQRHVLDMFWIWLKSWIFNTRETIRRFLCGRYNVVIGIWNLLAIIGWNYLLDTVSFITDIETEIKSNELYTCMYNKLFSMSLGVSISLTTYLSNNFIFLQIWTSQPWLWIYKKRVINTVEFTTVRNKV